MARQTPPRRRFWVEAALATSSSVLAVITLLSKEWIEIVSGVDPDHGNGSIEWLIVIILAVAAAILAALARAEWRRPATA
jgi:hypothetical protein